MIICLDLAEKEKHWTERVKSRDLQNLFGSFSAKMPEDHLELSFAMDVLNDLKFSDLVDDISSLSTNIVLHRHLRDKDKRPGTVYAFVVDVECNNNQVLICEKVMFVFFIMLFISNQNILRMLI